MSESFTPSNLQARAIREIKEWFLHRTAEQQVFRVFGYAGVGKTTITRHAIDELGLDTMARSADGMVSGSDGVLYGAFTGKAALVMTRKGTPASTIHSLIYRVSEATQTRSSGSSRRSPRSEPSCRHSIRLRGCSRSRGSGASRFGSTTSTSRASCSTSSRSSATPR